MSKVKRVKKTLAFFDDILLLSWLVKEGGIRGISEVRNPNTLAVFYDDRKKVTEQMVRDENTGEMVRVIPTYPLINMDCDNTYLNDKYENVYFEVVMCPCGPYIYVEIDDGEHGITIDGKGDIVIVDNEEDTDSCGVCSSCKDEEACEDGLTDEEEVFWDDLFEFLRKDIKRRR